MTALARPDVRLHASWAATLLEFGSEQVHGSGSWEVDEAHRGDVTLEGCRRLVEVLLARGDVTVPLGPEKVHCDYFWIVDGAVPEEGDVVGFLAVRHCLNDFLFRSGGHIGYSVRPSRRREGHARAALELGLDHLAGLGVERALLTAYDDNVGSLRTIEAAGGVHENTVEGGLRRYWIPLAGRVSEGASATSRPERP